MICENENALLRQGVSLVVGKCTEEATTTRSGWRWGDRDKGEELIVRITINLCASCAKRWDDNESEAAAEAEGS